MAGVAAALGRRLVAHPALAERLGAYFGPRATPAHLKMAQAPEGECELLEYEADGAPSPFPLVRCRNVFVLPGVPGLVRRKWAPIRALLADVPSLAPFRSLVFRLAAADEALVAPALDALAAAHAPRVAIGSYPVTGQPDGARLLVALEAKDGAALAAAGGALRPALAAFGLLSEEADGCAPTRRRWSRQSQS